MSDAVVIVAAKRTPMGGFQGSLSAVDAANLGATAIKSAVADSGVSPDDVSEVIMGNVLPAGIGQALKAAGDALCRSAKECWRDYHQ